jgi:hypothetical protein
MKVWLIPIRVNLIWMPLSKDESEDESTESKDETETIPLDNISENNSIKREDLRSMLTDLRDAIREQNPELDEIERRSDIISASVGIGTVELPLEPKKEIERPTKYVISILNIVFIKIMILMHYLY